jgi:hypothetical protein
LRKPVGVTKPPVMVMAVGLDSTKEETEAYEAPFLARGIAILVFDGPGQGEAQYDLAIRGDYETPVKAVIDFIGTRADLDSTRVGMWGVSLGGYYAPRAAAFDKRIKACIALGGLAVFDLLLYADAALSRDFSAPLLNARAALTVLAVSLLAIAAVRDGRWRQKPRFSRQAVFHGATLIIAGAFLVGVGALGEVLRLLQADWGATVQASLLAGASLMLAVALTSASRHCQDSTFTYSSVY